MGNTEKTVIEVLKDNYFIPAYQRGYRWDEIQVGEFIDDLHRFHQKMKSGNIGANDYYCMQSLVFKRENNKNIVIDGQQRLTTLYILISFLKQKYKDDDTLKSISLNDIEYETKGNDTSTKDFLRGLSENTKKYDTSDINTIKNRDIYHIALAYNTMLEKCNKDYNNDYLWIIELVKEDKIKYIIQDYSESNASEFEIFTSINTGKIALTDAELIRAKILIKQKDESQKDLKAKKWDEIEHTLQNNNFWYFIQNNEDNTASRINYIFKIVA